MIKLGLIGCGGLGRVHADCVKRIEGARFLLLSFALAVGFFTKSPSRASLRHLESMNGWISRASATSLTLAPGACDSLTAVRLSSIEYLWTFGGPFLAGIETPLVLLGQGVHFIGSRFRSAPMVC